MIGIVIPTCSEGLTLLKKVNANLIYQDNNIEVYESTSFKNDVLLVLTGYGKVKLANGLSYIKNNYQIDCLIGVGNCAAMDCKSHILDIALSNDSVQSDVNFTALGYNRGEIPNTQLTYYDSSQGLINAACNATKKLCYPTWIGRFASGDRFVARRNTSEAIKNTFNADFIDSECGSCGEFASMYNIPYLYIKGISNRAGNNAVNEYLKNAEKANEKACNVVFEMLKWLTVE